MGAASSLRGIDSDVPANPALVRPCALLLIAISACACSGGGGAAAPSDKAREALTQSLTMEQFVERQGVPLYPGASVGDGGTVTPGEPETRYELTSTTSDSLEKVVAFYMKQLPKLNPSVDKGAADLVGPTPKGTLVHITLGTKDHKTTIKTSAIVMSGSK